MAWPTVVDDSGDGVSGSIFCKALTDAMKVYIDAFFATKVLTIRPQVHTEEIRKVLKPEGISIGLYYGYLMPIFAADNEEIFMEIRVPYRWDGISNPMVRMRVCLEDTEDVGDVFKMRVAWEHFGCDEGVVPATSNNVDVQQAVITARNAQYDSYCLDFTIDYDIDGAGSELEAGCLMGLHVTRIAATGAAITNKIIILDTVVEFRRDKLGADWS